MAIAQASKPHAEMARQIQAHDWSRSGLGPMDGWPAPMRTVVELSLRSPAAMMTWWGPEAIMMYNDAYIPIAGARHGRLLGVSVFEGWPEVAELNRGILANVQAGKTHSLRNEHLVLYRNGVAEDVWLNVDYGPVEDERGRVIGVLCVVTETSAAQLTERRLAASEARLRNMLDEQRRTSEQLIEAQRQQAAILDGIGDIFYALDRDLRFTFFNTAAERFTRHSRSEVVGRRLTEAMPETAGSMIESLFKRVLQTRRPKRLEMGSLTRPGRWLDLRVFPTEEGIGVAVIDLTDQRAAEMALRESESRFRLVVETLPQLVWTCLPDGRCDYLSRQWLEYTGVPVEEQLGTRWIELVHPDDREQAARHRAGALAGEHDYDIDYRIRRYDGEYRWFKTRGLPVLGSEGRVAHWFGTSTDIQDIVAARELQASLRQQLEAQVALRTRERDRLWNVTQDLALVADNQGRFLEVNPAWKQVLGYDDEELLGKTSEWLEHPDDREKTRHARLETGGGRALSLLEIRFRSKDGQYRWLAWSAVLDGDQIYATARDITSQKLAETRLLDAQAQLRQAQKMEAIGLLTGGIAHDFNNLLASILASLQLAERARADEVRRYLETAMNSVHRAASLTQRLLAFGRRQALDISAIDVNELIRSMQEMIERTLGSSIAVSTELASDSGRALADHNQLESALLNLVINARDAMPEGGRLRIRTQRLVADADYCARNAGLAPGEYLALSVQDSGSGVAADIVDKIFDPFFTTKPLGQGTGLGLSMIYGFVKQLGGHVQIETEVGRGTTVCLLLPGTHSPAVQRLAPLGSLAAHAQQAEAAETILLVEDNPDLRDLAAKILGELGYRVLEAEDGEDALQMLDRETVDLLATDVGLPGLNGRQIAEIARQKQPGLKVLFITGYAESAARQAGFSEAGMAMISKPFSIDGLAAKVRQVLSA